MTDQPTGPADRRTATQLLIVSAAGAALAGYFAWVLDGFLSVIASVAMFGALGNLMKLACRHWASSHPGGYSAASFTTLALFFLASSTFIAWAMQGPGSNCSDCDSQGGWILTAAVLLAGWGFAGYLTLLVLKQGSR